MILRHLSIRRFRGINHLEWSPGGQVVCLVGPCDAGKSTILEAISWALHPYWTLRVSDSDFHVEAGEDPIRIEATVGGLPEPLLAESELGLRLRGWKEGGEIVDEPDDEHETVVTVRLTIDRELEPAWNVVTDREPVETPISHHKRRRLGVAYLGQAGDRSFAWSQGTPLRHMTESLATLSGVVADAARSARAAVAEADLGSLREAATNAQDLAKGLGYAPTWELKPLLDADALSHGGLAIALHDGQVPLRLAGLGSRRLVELALQQHQSLGGAMSLIDEIEYGLEPHRLHHLLRYLRARVEEIGGQCIMATHSAVPLEVLRAEDLRVVRTGDDGETLVRVVDSTLQDVVRRVPEALLSRRVIVCEGKTEVGLGEALDEHQKQLDGAPFAVAGVRLAVGEGSSAADTATKLAGLGYDVAFVGDSDVATKPSAEQMEQDGIRVFVWPDGMCTEERLATDLPIGALQELVDIAAGASSQKSVADQLRHQLEDQFSVDPANIQGLVQEGCSEATLRGAIAHAAKDHQWFKRIDLGELAGKVVFEHYAEIEGKPLRKLLDSLAQWAHDG
jgi:putative ATP-dependent endonuclease of OLD family